MADAVAIVTATGGLMSHAAVIARAWGKPAVVGVERLEVFGDHAVLDGRRVEPSDWLTVDGSIGAVAVGRIEVPSEPIPEVDTLVAWAGELGIRMQGTSADTTESIPTLAEAPSWERRDDDILVNHVLVILAIKRWATPASLAQVLAVGDDRLAALLERLQVAGSLAEPTPRGVRLSEQGVERAARVFAETAQLFDSAAAQLLEGFDKPNRGLKEIVTAWQIRDVDGEQVPNRHDDAAYDAAVVAGLRDVHGEIDPWLAGLAETAPMIEFFRQRLGRAVDRICAGDHRWLVSPLLDSYHTVWFELHECLLRLARRSRSEEAKAGRAS
jgi:pyruvate,orthophosphate dikinase